MTVDAMTPTMVAAVLGLDEENAIRAVPFEPMEMPTAPTADGPAQVRRIR